MSEILHADLYILALFAAIVHSPLGSTPLLLKLRLVHYVHGLLYMDRDLPTCSYACSLKKNLWEPCWQPSSCRRCSSLLNVFRLIRTPIV